MLNLFCSTSLLVNMQVHDKISERIISEKFNVSRTIVREAIVRLKDEGWLYTKAKSGTYVSPVDSKNMADSLGVRMILEPNVIAMAMPYMTKEDIEFMRENCRKMKESWGESYIEFEKLNHEIIDSRCSNTMLVKILSTLNDSYQRLTIKTSNVEGRKKASIREWNKIINAIESKNSALAMQCMTQHIHNATDVFGEMLEEEMERK